MDNDNNTLRQAVVYRKNRNRKKLWYRILSMLSAIVVFVTTYALILPAITMSDDPICGKTEHTHTDECYITELVCEAGTTELAQENGISSEEAAMTETSSEEQETEAVAEITENVIETATEETTSAEEITTSIEITTLVEISTLTEEVTEIVENGTAQVSTAEVDSAEESTTVEEVTFETETNVEEITTVTEITTQLETVIQIEETTQITVTAEQTTAESVLTEAASEEATEAETTAEVTQTHDHTEECYKKVLKCETEEHTHDEIFCYADESADAETAEDWEKTIPTVLTGDYAYDLILVAKTQLGYTESQRNVQLDAEGRYKNYSRYGAWFGDAYADWQEEFVSFCLHYANVPEEEFPGCATVYEWVNILTEKELLRDKEGYTPVVGDIVFLANNGVLTSVGIIESISEDGLQLEVIEGNTAEGKVELVSYTTDSDVIYGYAVLPEKEFLCNTQAHLHTTACYDENSDIICTAEEHCHTDECLGLYPLTEEERAQVDEVIALIEAMPTADEIDEKLIAFEDADDMDGYQEYYVSVGQQGKRAYNAYSALNEKQKAYITEIDKLMESSWLWSAVTLAATAAARADDVASVSGDGIKVQLFNYSDHINKTADHKSWRTIASYFTFRNSSTTPGDTPSDTVIVPTWNINSDHDIDGFTKTHATVERVLTENGTPVLDLTRNADGSARVDPGVSREIRDLSYLFSDTGDPEVSAYSPTNTFLQKNGNYYWYDSALNAVDYDVSANLIRLRSYVERNSTTAGYTTKYGDFTPFNYTGGVQLGLNTDGVTPYHILSADVDYWFGMTMEVNFFQTKGGIIDSEEMQFRFSGDDDVWVFVDDVLVLDLGGTHGTVDGSINFATGQVLQYLSWSGANSTTELQTGGSTTSFPTTIRACFDAAGKTPNGGWNADGTTFADYSEHTLKIFYMERGSAVANCKLSFSLPALPDKSLTVTKDLVTDEATEVADYIKESLSYKFRVMKADSEGNSTGELFIKGGTTFDILENANKVGTGTVGTDGTFTIKAGQSAQFTEMLLKGGGHINYVVEELLPDNSTGQYSGVEYDVSGAGGETITDETSVNNFTAYRTGKLSAEQTQAVTYRNKVDVSKLSYLEISKEVAPNAVFDADKTFNMQVTLGDILLPVGTAYTVNGEPATVETEGIIPLKAGDTAIISEGILSGTEYNVKELNTVEENMLATYTAEAEPTGTVTATANGVSGVVGTGSRIKINVVNQNNDFALNIPLSKQIIDNDGTYNISIDAVEVAPDTFEMIGDMPGAVIPVTGDSVVTGELNLGYTAGTVGRKYYKIFESFSDDEFIYDDTFYIVEVETTGSAAELISIKKNGTEEIAVDSVLGFVNQKTVKLNVTKEIVQKLSDVSFDFAAVVTLDGEPVSLTVPDEGAGYSVDGNVISFSLAHGDTVSIPYIPHGAEITVTELNTDGYISYYSVAGVHSELQEGSSVTLDFESSDITVHFTNDAVYKLPETGSTGTFMYTLGGSMLTISACAVLLYKAIKRRKEDPASS